MIVTLRPAQRFFTIRNRDADREGTACTWVSRAAVIADNRVVLTSEPDDDDLMSSMGTATEAAHASELVGAVPYADIEGVWP